MNEIEENIRSVRASLPPAVELVAVSKTHPVEAIREAYRAGQRVFGENKVQEMCAKQPELPGDVRWHLIGHLQSNKVKYIVPFVEMIQSVDSAELLAKIDAAAGKVGRRIDCLLEVRIACEETKYGLEPEAALALALSEQTRHLEHVRVRGLMGMASNTPDREQVRREFFLAQGSVGPASGTGPDDGRALDGHERRLPPLRWNAARRWCGWAAGSSGREITTCKEIIVEEVGKGVCGSGFGNHRRAFQ